MPVSALALDNLTFQTPGATEDLRDDILSSSLLQAAQDEETVDPLELFSAARADYGRIIGALYANARYSGVISITIDGREVSQIPPTRAPQAISRIVVTVNPGPEFSFGRTEIAPQAPGTEIPEEFIRGATARASVVGDAVDAAVDGWRSVGHAKASSADQSILARHAEERLDVSVRIAPGPRVAFGDLAITGNQRVRTQRIREIAGFPTGEIYDGDEVEQTVRRLRRTGAFRSVAATEAETVGPDGRLDFNLAVVEEKRRRIGTGIELSSLDGLTLSGFWLHRNLFGGAERLRVDAEIAQLGNDRSGIDYTFGARFERPATFNPDTSFFALTEVKRLDEPDYELTGATVGVGLSRYFSENMTGEAGVSIRYADVTDALGENEYLLLTFPLGLTWDRRDDSLDPTSGIYIDGELTPFVSIDGGDNGGRLYLDTRGYLGLGAEDRVVLAGRAQIGSIIGASLDGTPPDFRFFSGGGGTVRGHSYQSLGIDLGNDEMTGGQSFLGLSAEARVGITEKIGVVAFYDWGQIGPDAFPGDDSESHAGAGLGLRYDTGIGPIRLDVAAPVSGEEDGGVQIYIGIGQAF